MGLMNCMKMSHCAEYFKESNKLYLNHQCKGFLFGENDFISNLTNYLLCCNKIPNGDWPANLIKMMTKHYTKYLLY